MGAPLEVREVPAPAESVDAPAFHTPAWQAALARAFGVRTLWLGFFRAGSPVCVLPVHSSRVGPLALLGSPARRLGTPPALLPQIAPADAPAVLEALDRWLAGRRAPYFQLSWPFDTPLPTGWSEEDSDNLELSLAPPLAELWDGVAKAQRYEVRKAVRAGVRLHWADPANFFERYRPLLDDTYHRQGLKPNVPEALYHAASGLPRSRLRVLCASKGSTVLAAAWLLLEPKRVYYWDAASTAEGRKRSASHLLIWTLIRWARRRGFEVLDFVGTSVGGRGGSRPGIGHFKMSFGARPRRYRILYRRARWLDFALIAYRRWSALKNRPKIPAP